MRRNFLCALLFVLALAVQAVVPAAARMAMGAGSASQLCRAPDGSGAAAQVSVPGGGHATPESCNLCALCCAGGASPLGARHGVVDAAAFDGHVLIWSVADDATFPAPRVHAVGARAPPAFS